MDNLMVFLAYEAFDTMAFVMALYFIFKYSPTTRNRVISFFKRHLGVYEARGEIYRTNLRLDREIRNRRILKDRVAKHTGRY